MVYEPIKSDVHGLMRMFTKSYWYETEAQSITVGFTGEYFANLTSLLDQCPALFKCTTPFGNLYCQVLPLPITVRAWKSPSVAVQALKDPLAQADQLGGISQLHEKVFGIGP